MTYYASKELIDRAAACMSDFLDSRISESPIVLLSELAKAEPLLTNADREEAILRWLREAKVWPQDSSIGCPGYWLGEEHLEQAAILFRGGPASEPVPEVSRCADCGEPTPVLLAHCCEQPKPSPEQRPSSALLDAARAMASYGPPYTSTGRTIDVDVADYDAWLSLRRKLVKAIKDEEARGPSDAEQLRKERDEAIKAADGHADEVEELRAQVAQTDSKIAAMELHGNSAQHWHDKAQAYKLLLRELRKERDEALEPLSVDVGGEVLVLRRHEAVEKIRELAARAEKAEASADAKLRKLRGGVSSLLDIANSTDATSYTQARRSSLDGRIAAYSQCISEVDRLLANPPSEGGN
jgi:hypothetical protein